MATFYSIGNLQENPWELILAYKLGKILKKRTPREQKRFLEKLSKQFKFPEDKLITDVRKASSALSKMYPFIIKTSCPCSRSSIEMTDENELREHMLPYLKKLAAFFSRRYAKGRGSLGDLVIQGVVPQVPGKNYPPRGDPIWEIRPIQEALLTYEHQRFNVYYDFSLSFNAFKGWNEASHSEEKSRLHHIERQFLF